jgi:hypothetical protein
LYDQKEVKMKYISMKIDPKGRIPEIGMMKNGEAYQGAAGIGLRRDREDVDKRRSRGERVREREEKGEEGERIKPCNAVHSAWGISSADEVSPEDGSQHSQREGNK